MLKIKDEVDLKELEKFGFKLSDITETPKVVYERCEYYSNYEDDENYDYTSIDLETREIYSNNAYESHSNIDLNNIEDLIFANLVEKVEE